ncbi:unnamed protein product, partial [Rotaria socialis]
KRELGRRLAPVLNPLIRCIVSEESRFQHLYVQISAGAKRRPSSCFTNDILKNVSILLWHVTTTTTSTSSNG